MAVVSVTELLADHQGDAGFTAGQGYQGKLVKQYQVIVDSTTDDTGVVLSAPGIPVLASSAIFAYAGIPLLVTRLRAIRDSKTRLAWNVHAEYESPKRSKSDKHPDRDKEKPTEWRDTVEWKPAKFTAPVYYAKLKTNFTGGFYKSGAFIHPMNAAGEKFDPPPERDVSRGVLRIVKRMDSFPTAIDLQFADTVNQSNFSITKPGFDVNFAAGHAKFEPIEGTLRYHITRSGQEIAYWENEIQLSVLSTGWDITIPNVGLSARAIKGDPDGYGGTIQSVPAGMAQNRRLVDPQGKPLSHHWPLDLAGQPLQDGAAMTFVTYGIYEERDFSSLNFNTDNQL